MLKIMVDGEKSNFSGEEFSINTAAAFHMVAQSTTRGVQYV